MLFAGSEQFYITIQALNLREYIQREVETMENTMVRDSVAGVSSSRIDYQDGVWRLLETELADILNEEIKKAAQELLEEQKKMIRQLVDENKTIIRQIIDEEKQAAWDNQIALRKSILTISP